MEGGGRVTTTFWVAPLSTPLSLTGKMENFRVFLQICVCCQVVSSPWNISLENMLSQAK